MTDLTTKAILDFLRLIADKNNWGYFDPSGCPKGAGEYKEAWIGEDHPLDIAERLLMDMEAK
jgi:hypothetical protein